jgi:uncharacterized protein YqeY
MSLKQDLQDRLKEAMRNKEALKRTLLRTLLSEIKNVEIDLKKELNDEEIISVFSKQAQQRKDSIEAFERAARFDLVEKETLELTIIETYLPEQMDTVEIMTIIDSVILEVNAQNPSDIGKVMSVLMPKIKNRADGKTVNLLVLSKLKDLA